MANLIEESTTQIHKAWELFFPATVRILITWVYFVLITGIGITKQLAYLSQIYPPVPLDDSIWGFIQKLNLTSLIPVFFVIAILVIAYIVNRLIFGIALLIPINTTVKISGRHADKRWLLEDIWHRYPEIKTVYGVIDLADSAVFSAELKGYEKQLTPLKHADRKFQEAAQISAFLKFLCIWIVCCFVYGVGRGGIASNILMISILLLLITVTLLAISFTRQVYYHEEYEKSKLYIARQLLAAEKRDLLKPESETAKRISEELTRYEENGVVYKWGLSFQVTSWWKMFKYFRWKP